MIYPIIISIIAIILYLLTGMSNTIVHGGVSLPATLYHGSPTLIKDHLEPRPSRVIDNELAVFATPFRADALFFISEHTDDDFLFATFNNKLHIGEMYPGAFNLLKASGYIYSVSSKGFHSDPRLGMKNREFINDNPVPILDTEIIENAYDELKKISGIKWIPHTKTKKFMKKRNIT